METDKTNVQEQGAPQGNAQEETKSFQVFKDEQTGATAVQVDDEIIVLNVLKK